MNRPNVIVVDGEPVTFTTSSWSPGITSVHVPDWQWPVGYVKMLPAGRWSGTAIVGNDVRELPFTTERFWQAARLLAETHYNNRKVQQ
jgi:hypothetical protein